MRGRPAERAIWPLGILGAILVAAVTFGGQNVGFLDRLWAGPERFETLAQDVTAAAVLEGNRLSITLTREDLINLAERLVRHGSLGSGEAVLVIYLDRLEDVDAKF